MKNKTFIVSEDTEVVLDGKKFLLESGDKITEIIDNGEAELVKPGQGSDRGTGDYYKSKV